MRVLSIFFWRVLGFPSFIICFALLMWTYSPSQGSVSDETAKKLAAQLAYVQSVVSATLSALSTEQES